MSTSQTQTRKSGRVSLRQHVLLAALDCSGGDIAKAFTAEDLLLAAWKRDPMAWGLRGHEREHPDSEKIYTELDRASIGGRNVRGGLVGLGLLEKVRQRTYRLTPTGLNEASTVAADPMSRAKAERTLANAIAAVLSHAVFGEWLNDPAMPKHFRDAGHFWGIAPGTPPSVIRARIREIDNTLATAQGLLDGQDHEEISARHGRALFDRKDIERAMEFQATLKERFSRDLKMLQVALT
jgi:hypothetical protein